MWGVEWAVVLAMISFNSVFAAYEIALTSVSLARLEVLVREKRPGAKAAFEMKDAWRRTWRSCKWGSRWSLKLRIPSKSSRIPKNSGGRG